MSAQSPRPGQPSSSPGLPPSSTPLEDSTTTPTQAATRADTNATSDGNGARSSPNRDDYSILPSETNTRSTPSNPVDPTRTEFIDELDFSIGPPGQTEEEGRDAVRGDETAPSAPVPVEQHQPLESSNPITEKDYALPPSPTPHFQEPDSPRLRTGGDDAPKRAASTKRSPSIKGTLGRKGSHGHSRSRRLSNTMNTPRTPRSGQVQGAAPSTPQPPILSLTPAVASDQPEFAELLTPAQLRKKRKQRAPPSHLGTGLGVLAGRPVLAGASKLGFATPEGDLYRGATTNPVAPDDTAVVDDDAITVTSSSSSGSSASGIGARATEIVQRVGEAIGMRRGSSSSGSDSVSSASSDSTSAFSIGRFGRALSRTISRATNDSAAEERPRRVYVPRRREFMLLLPPGEKLPQKPNEATVITTPMLPPVLEAIRALRVSTGAAELHKTRPHLSHRKHHQHSDTAVRRGGSAPGRKRQQFVNPPIPRMPRVEALRGAGHVRPKSASDLLGMATGPGRNHSSPDLASARNSSDSMADLPPLPRTPPPKPQPKPAWWLDVSCPTWKDLRDIGELLSLHPLTLEDVLHQDPREKLDAFHKLGYYFVVIRALDEQYFKYTPGTTGAPGGAPGAEVKVGGTGYAARIGDNAQRELWRTGWGFGRATGPAATKVGEKVEIIENDPGKEGLEGVGVGGINLYLVVFEDGIVSFHYDDVSKHVTRVRDRILQVQTAVPSPDWIAHGLIDSIVDAFFPLMGYIDGAVDDLDSLTIDPTRDPRTNTEAASRNVEMPNPSDDPYSKLGEEHAWLNMALDLEKMSKEESAYSTSISKPKRSALRRRHGRASTTMREAAKAATEKASAMAKKVKEATGLRMPLRSRLYSSKWLRPLLYAKLWLLPIADGVDHVRDVPDSKDIFDRSTMLRSIANMRRLVTGLSRMLGGKHTVVMSLLKRTQDSADDVAAYLSDVHDHILLLQTSLYHYEYILAHCQPSYMSYLRMSGKFARGDTDKLILALTTITVGILPMQVVCGMMSLNVHVPHNGMSDPPDGIDTHREPDDTLAPFNWFIGIVFFICLIALGVLFIIRYWRWVARKKWTKRRGGDLPSNWDGFWGLQ